MAAVEQSTAFQVDCKLIGKSGAPGSTRGLSPRHEVVATYPTSIEYNE